MISVVMANYNGEQFIGEAVTSVINQDYDDYELIIVDDGSVDGSRAIIAGFRNRYPDRVKAIYQPDNRGQAAAFNVGIAASRGDPVCFLDSDDLWFPSKLKNVHAFFARCQGVAIHQHNLLLIRNGEITDERFRDEITTGDYFGYVKKTRTIPQFVATTGLSFPRRVLERVLPIPEVFKTCADGYLTRTCFCYGEVASTDKCWGAYRIHSANNVFGNPQFDVDAYISDLLIPILNEYYRENGIDLAYPEQRNGRYPRQRTGLIHRLVTLATILAKKVTETGAK